MIYGDTFSVSKKTKLWLQVRTKEDKYKGYVKNRKFSTFLKPTHKVHVLKSRLLYKIDGEWEAPETSARSI